MTPDKQRIEIAEACEIDVVQKIDNGKWFGLRQGSWVEVPDFLNDLNAMHEAEKVLTATQQEQYWLRLVDVIWLPVLAEYPDANFSQENIKITLLFATASQRAEAFLRTLNLWKE